MSEAMLDRYPRSLDCDADQTRTKEVVIPSASPALAAKLRWMLILCGVLLTLPYSRLASPARAVAEPAFVRQPAMTSTAAAATAVITFTLKAEPGSRQDFRFHGDLGDFSLDQADADDGDTITETITFTVTPGVYIITQETPKTWLMSAISCSPRALGQINLTLGKVTLTVQAGEHVHCTFVNERGITVRTRVYHDHNGNRSPTLGEPYLAGWAITLYHGTNILIGTQLTNQYGKAHFNYLRPGEYTACQTTTAPWSNTQPGVDDDTYAAPCYSFALRAGEVTTLWFGNQQAGDTIPVSQPTAPRAIAIAQGADVASDASGYDGWQFVDTDLNQDARGPTVFLPLTFVP